MVGTSLNLISLGLTSQMGLGLGINRLGANLGNLLQLQGSNGDGFNLSEFVADALPWAAGATALGMAAGAGIYFVRRWRDRQAALPPPGMTDARPDQLKTYFQTPSSDRERARPLLLGYSPTASDETLAETERRIASEIADLQAALTAPHNEKNKKRIAEAVQSYEDIQAFLSLRRGRTVRVRREFLDHPETAHATAVRRLSALEAHRLVLIAHYFQKAHISRKSDLPDTEPEPKTVSRYAGLDERQRRQLHLLALRTWQSLSPEDKDFFWELRQKGDDLRGTSVAPDFLRLFARLVPNPKFPMNMDALAGELAGQVTARVNELKNGPELPPHFRNIHGGILLLRSGERMMGNIKIHRHLGTAKVRITREVGPSDNRQVSVLEYSPEQVLTIIGDEKKSQVHWTHPDIQLNGDDNKTAPGIVADLREYPSPSLGGDHRVLVNFADERLTKNLQSLEVLREKLKGGEVPPASAVRRLAGALLKKNTNPDAEAVAAKSGPGILHALMDVLNAGGQAERALLIQIILQFLGIPSAFERRDATGEGETAAFWVRVAVPGEPQVILCPGRDGAVPEGDPDFASFQDQTPQSGSHGAPTNGLIAPAPIAHAIVSAQGEDNTPIPAPAPPPPDDFDDRPTQVISRPRLFDTPVSAAPDAETDEPTVQVPFETLKSESLRHGVTAELKERYALFATDTDAAREFARRISEKVYAAWDQAGRPDLEANEQGEAVLIPERFIEAVMNAWKASLQKNKGAMARRILAELGDRGDRAARRKPAAASLPQASVLPDDDDNRPTLIPPVAAPERENIAVPLTRRSRATPPPLPTPEEFARQQEEAAIERATDILKLRYPVFHEPPYQGLATAIARNAYRQAGGDPDAQLEAILGLVAQTAPALETRASLQPVLAGIRAADAVIWELTDRYPAFRNAGWKGFLPNALAHIFRAWQIAGSKFETAPDGRTVVPEQVFESGFADFTSGLTRDYPNVEPEIFVEAFIEGDSDIREKRWVIEVDPEKDADIIVGDGPDAAGEPAPEAPVTATLSIPTPAPTSDAPVSGTASAVSNISVVRRLPEAAPHEDTSSEILRRYPSLEAHPALVRTLAERSARLAAEDASTPAVDRTLAELIRALADTAVPKTPREEILRSLIEKDVADELAERYGVFQEAAFAKLKSVMARRIYDVWDGNNRTFNGTAAVLPLRVPEKFVDQGMNVLLTPLRASDPEMADRIMRSYRGTRAERAERLARPASAQAVRPVPITQDNVRIELMHRFPAFFGAYGNLATAFAKDIYEAWLQEDPERTLEQSGAGLRGLIPESVLEKRIPLFYARVEQAGHAALVRAMKEDDKGPRSKRGTAVLEFDVRFARTG
ncbi:MAG TPA: hypothetical protein VLJ37_09670 [bacterium]|nr:hypothetical protein [bacterium]